MTIRVLVVDDQALLRTAFRALIDAEDDMQVVGEAACGTEAVRLAPAWARGWAAPGRVGRCSAGAVC